mgnify:CR=1 FL=1
MAVRTARRALSGLHRMLCTGQQMTCIAQKAAACHREVHDPAAAFEQGHSHVLFQLLDLAAERRLRHVQARGCTAEVQFLGHGHKTRQLTQIH